MSAIRLARAFTGRKYIIKFEGCYHGHADPLLVKAGSGVATLGIPGSAGVLEEQAQFTLALPFNDVAALEQAFEKIGGKAARVHGAGRTDAGVHALGQCAHVDVDSRLQPARLAGAQSLDL